MVDATKVLAVRKEAVYGTDIVPTLADNAVLTRNFRSQPIETDRLERNLDTGAWGQQKSAATNERQTMTFEVELAGSGAAGTPPRWMELLEGCGMAPPIEAAGLDARQKFALSTANQSSLSTRHWKGNQLRKGVGARGTWSLDMTAGALPFLSIALTALIPAAAPFAVANPVGADFSDWREPLEVNSANTVILLDNYALTLRSLRLAANVQTNVRNLVGARYVNRGPHGVTGEMVIEAPSLDAKDYIAALRQFSLIALSVVHGTQAGNIIELSAPRIQITSISEDEEDGKLMWTLGVSATIDTGADELTIIAK